MVGAVFSFRGYLGSFVKVDSMNTMGSYSKELEPGFIEKALGVVVALSCIALGIFLIFFFCSIFLILTPLSKVGLLFFPPPLLGFSIATAYYSIRYAWGYEVHAIDVVLRSSIYGFILPSMLSILFVVFYHNCWFCAPGLVQELINTLSFALEHFDRWYGWY